jgi:hypothetical protein
MDAGRRTSLIAWCALRPGLTRLQSLHLISLFDIIRE